MCQDTDATQGGGGGGLPGFDAVVLAGGAGRRLGGAAKPGLDVGGVTLLDRVVATLSRAGRLVVVGPERPTATPVVWAREQPPGGGPAAAVAAGLAAVEAPWVAVVAADLPFLRSGTVDALRAAAVGRDGALLVDDEGREQLLAGVWSTAALRAAAGRRSELAGCSMRVLLDGLSRAHVRVDADGPPDWLDCDTPDDLQHAREHA